MAAGVVLASGAGTRVGAELNKVYLPLAGQRVLAWSLDAFAQVSEIGVLVLVIRPQDRELADEVLAARPDRAAVEIVLGGVRRQDSELNALRALAERIHSGDVDSVLIHDAARPLVTPELIRSVLRATRESGAAIPGLPRRDLVPIGATEDVVTGEPETAGEVVTVQTPQGSTARCCSARTPPLAPRPRTTPPSSSGSVSRSRWCRATRWPSRSPRPTTSRWRSSGSLGSSREPSPGRHRHRRPRVRPPGQRPAAARGLPRLAR